MNPPRLADVARFRSEIPPPRTPCEAVRLDRQAAVWFPHHPLAPRMRSRCAIFRGPHVQESFEVETGEDDPRQGLRKVSFIE
jgi:hypothetical protein